jgi:F-type H+-transporting ATPase subunit gamma
MLNRALTRGFGAGNEKILKARIKSVSSIGKITKAMKMVAAAKMRAEISRLMAGGNFGYTMATNWFKGDETARKFLPELGPDTKTLLVPFTSDRGLCGGVNSGIVREVKAIAGKKRDKYSIFAIGEKGALALVRPFPDILYKSITNVMTPASFTTAASVGQTVELAAKDQGCGRIELVFNEFKNVVTSKIKRTEIISRAGFRLGHHKSAYEIEEPDQPLASEIYYDLYLASSIYHAMLNNASSEQSARMTAMESASKNCGEMIGKLRLEYNKVRQAKITMELCEIISGAEAL